MKYKDIKGYLIAVDLDGTLIQGFDDYDHKSFELLKELAKNNYVIISTGRPYRSSKYYYDLLELNTPIVNYNGAWVHHPNDNNFQKSMITINKNNLINFTEEKKHILHNIFCEIEDNIYVLRRDDEIEPYLHLDGGTLHTGEFKNILPNNPNGAILFINKDCEQELEEYVMNHYNNEVKIRYWFTTNVIVCELYNPLTSKANALKQICDYYHIDRKKTIAIGDGHNDIEMLEFCEIGVAMGNSHKDLFPVANFITDDVSNNGVYNFFMRDIEDK